MVKIYGAAFVASLLVLPFTPFAANAADNYPDKVVRLIVPYPPGGVTDIMAREIAQQVSDDWGKPMIVENKTGASGIIGVRYVAQSKPDGHTILFGNTHTFSLNPNLFKDLPYDPVKDFAPITLVANVSNALLVSKDFPAQSIEELVAMAKEKPGELTFASNSPGSTNHLSGEMFKMQADIDIRHIPYKSSTEAVVDIIGGRVSMMFDNLTTATSFMRDGRLRPLAVTSGKRVDSLPDVRTMEEAGFSDFVITPWWGIFAPAGTPQDVVDKLHTSIVAALKDKGVSDYFKSQETEIIGNTPQEFDAIVRSDLAHWGNVIKNSNVSME